MLQHGLDVTGLEKDLGAIQQDWVTSSQSAHVDLQNTGVHSNQRWREKILRRGSEEACVVLIGAIKDELFVSPKILKE